MKNKQGFLNDLKREYEALFLNEYKKLFVKVVQELKRIKEENEEVKREFQNIDIAVFGNRLLTKIVFFYFLQTTGCLADNDDFMRNLFEKKYIDYENFYEDVLKYLFYEALRVPKENGIYQKFNCRIPYLNNELFIPEYDWENVKLNLPNKLFSNEKGDGILDIFDRFEFTLKEKY